MAIQLVPVEQWLRSETAVLGVFENHPPKTGSALDDLLHRLTGLGDLRGRPDELHVLYPEDHRLPKRVLVVGLGSQDKYTYDAARKAMGRAVKKAKSLKTREMALLLDTFSSPAIQGDALAYAAGLVAGLSLYRYQDYVTPDPNNRELAPKVFLAASQSQQRSAAGQRGVLVAECANFARSLANQPGNSLYPEALAEVAQAMAKTSAKLSVKVLKKAQLEKEGFGALLGVGSGSARPPVLIEIRYQGAAGAKPVALVGKGITFDSGGICLKPAAKMEDMRFDMSGAAAVLGIVRAVAALQLPVNLVAVIPAAENMPSGSALRPGDIVRSLSGRFIEVLNTDAEGRLILADGLTYACRHQPERIIDLATLTGAVTVALGHLATGLLGNHEAFLQEIQEAAAASGERVWQLPLWEEYQELIKSEVADMSNVSPKPGAGTIIGGVFLQKFAGATPWVHLDIAGTAYGEEGPIYGKGATGVGVRLIVEWFWTKYGAQKG